LLQVREYGGNHAGGRADGALLPSVRARPSSWRTAHQQAFAGLLYGKF